MGYNELVSLPREDRLESPVIGAMTKTPTTTAVPAARMAASSTAGRSPREPRRRTMTTSPAASTTYDEM